MFPLWQLPYLLHFVNEIIEIHNTKASGHVGTARSESAILVQTNPLQVSAKSKLARYSSHDENWGTQTGTVAPAKAGPMATDVWLNLSGVSTEQSSARTKSITNVPQNAIDGNFDTDYSRGSCTSTALGRRRGAQWWRATLPVACEIRHVSITRDVTFKKSNRMEYDSVQVLVDGKECAASVEIPLGQTVVIPCFSKGREV